jgi:ATP adenylyltransferase
MPYILGIKEEVGCIFCDEILNQDAAQSLVIHRGSHAFVVLNLYPYTIGHLMVVPYRHLSRLADLTSDELDEATSFLQKAERVVEAQLRVTHHHVGINLGRCAGAGVDGHIHIHLVPMRAGSSPHPPPGSFDTPPEPLQVTRDRLARAWSGGA